ncbi:MAG TPA: response regulator [Gallionellaceae bacterium]
MLDAIVKLSQRRQPRIKLLDDTDAENADVVMIDGADTRANRWAHSQSWLQSKVMIWVDAPAAPDRTVVQRPIQWTALPMILADALEKAPINSTEMPATESVLGSVLVVDDSLAVRAQLRSLLETHGLTVTDVDSAEAALNTAAASPFDCILMDVLMPGMNGYDACRRIKEKTVNGKKPTVIMLTSKTSPFDRIKGKMAGCDAYLTKPIDPAHLYQVVSQYIEKSAESGAVRQHIAPQYN